VVEMSEVKSWKEGIKDFVLMLGGTGVVLGGLWGFYMAVKFLFGA